MSFFIRYKGSIIALLATISFSNVYIFSKKAMVDVDLPAFGLLWFFCAIIWSFIYCRIDKKRVLYSSLSSKSKYYLILISLSELISTTCFFLSIKLTDNPAVVSFLANMSPIFVIIISYIFLKERYGIVELIGIFITLMGILLINKQSGSFSFQMLLNPASISALLFAFFYGLSLILAKQTINEIPSSLISLSRNIVLFISFLSYAIYLQEVPVYTQSSFFYILSGSFLGPFMGVYLTFLSLKYIEASLSTLIITSRSFFIILISFFVLDILPSSSQLIGGFLTMLGVLVLSIWKSKKHIN